MTFEHLTDEQLRAEIDRRSARYDSDEYWTWNNSAHQHAAYVDTITAMQDELKRRQEARA